MKTHNGVESVVNVALAGSTEVYQFSDKEIDAAIVVASQQSAPHTGTLTVTLKSLGNTNINSIASGILMAYVLRSQLVTIPLVTTQAPPQKRGLSTYHLLPSADVGVLKPSGMRAFMLPILGVCVAAGKSHGNNVAFVVGRNLSIRPVRAPPGATDLQHMREFVHMLMDGHERVELDSLQEVRDRQNRPDQRRQIDEHEFALDMSYERNTLEQFQKKEHYGFEIKDPRGIVGLSGPLKLSTSQVGGALTKICKKHQWYIFGRSPAEVSRLIPEALLRLRTCIGTEHILETDYSRFDGTINDFHRRLDLEILGAAFTPQWTEAIVSWHGLVYGNKVRAKHDGQDITYEQGFSQATGDPFTSVLHTLRNAFMAYSAARQSRTPQQAWACLGAYGGDDGFTLAIDPAVYSKVAERTGLKLKCVVRTPGQCVTMLGRVWGPGSWEGDPNNCSDIFRSLRGFHLTTQNPTVPNEIVAYNKALCLNATDSGTLLLGDLCNKILTQCRPAVPRRGAPKYVDRDVSQMAIIARDHPEEVFVNHPAQWQMEYFMTACGQATIVNFERWLRDPTARWDMPAPIANLSAELPALGFGVIVDGWYFEDPAKEEVVDEEVEPIPAHVKTFRELPRLEQLRILNAKNAEDEREGRPPHPRAAQNLVEYKRLLASTQPPETVPDRPVQAQMSDPGTMAAEVLRRIGIQTTRGRGRATIRRPEKAPRRRAGPRGNAGARAAK
jgi:hypothetical protein